MSYPGNAALSPEIQERILNTYEQTLDLASKGSRPEATLGCDFILRLDPMFEVARKLLDRLERGQGPIDVSDLRPGAMQTAPEAPLFNELENLDFELPELLDAPPTEAPAAGGGDLKSRLAAHLERRELREVGELAAANKAAVAADPALRSLVDTARSRLEAEPYVSSFIDSARQALQGGQIEEADRLVTKARSLDATHPGIGELEQVRGFYTDPERRMGSRRLGIEVEPSAGAKDEVMSSGLGLSEGPEDRGTAFSPVFGEGKGFGLDLDSPPAAARGATAASSSDRRIRDLLDEGQVAFDQADYQSAIDAWSRIFLIDIDHSEAVRRIEAARKLKAEHERQVEEIYHEGMANLDAGDQETAKERFEQVLEMQPSHLAAREYLQQIETGVVRRPGAPVSGASFSLSQPAAPVTEPETTEAELREEILVPPDPGELRDLPTSGARSAVAASQPRRPGRSFLVIGSAVLVLAVLVGAIVQNNWKRWFPNAKATTPVEAAAPTPDPIARATALHESGKTAMAIAQLKRLPPGDPYYDQAQALITQWESLETPATPQGTTPALSPEEQAQRGAELDGARKAYRAGEYLRAAEGFERASKIGPAEGEDRQMLADAKHRLEPLLPTLQLFRQREWELALPTLWRLHEADPANLDVSRLIVDSYYDLGVRDLQRADAKRAVEDFKEALVLRPGDPLLQRHYLFAQTYQNRPKDLLFRIYVKYLPFR